jgi:N-acetylneuraminic acid mutarotase
MAFGGGSTVVVFGGDTGHYPDRHLVDDTWEYDTSTHTWTAISPAGAKPSARSEHAMAYAGGSKVIMFGGADAEWNHLSDTWEYDTTTHAWTPISLSGTNPPARFAHAMAYAGGSTVVLFGGNHDGTILSDTWEYHVVNQTWTNVTGGATPPFRWQHAMSDAGNSTVLMFGGIEEYDPPTRINRDDTWIYDATAHTWTEYNTSGVKPAARHLHRMAWLGGNRVLLFAGEATLGPGLDDWDQVSDTWQYDMAAHSWAQKVTATPCAHPRQKWVEWWKPGFFMVKWTDLEMHDTNACPVTYELKSWRDD